ncbi:unnamed protein product [Adineta steineri]|uniref:Centrosomin N-terminal motif 1 domain-containing protein n=1 Tax=Adineta steineri TaxID=433720 RepID=A0A819L7F1_9BILA|nr:unnamed protein product [Adineta steineri]
MAEEEVQDLKRENFNLKLRIYFLEEQHQPGTTNTNENTTRTTYVNQLESEIEQLRRRVFSQSTQSDGLPTVYNFDYDDERRAFREELEKFRKENELLRQSLQLNSSKNHGDIRDKFTTPIVGQSIQTSTSIDSALDRTTSGMSSTYLNTNNLQTELNEYKERERKFQEQIDSLRKQLNSSLPQNNDTNKIRAELDQARRQIQQYEIEINNYQQQQTKAERVLQRLKIDYEDQIARLVGQQGQQTSNYENHQQEPLIARIRFTYPLHDRASSNINIDEYHQAIMQRDRIIEQLEEAINEITIRLRTPFTLMLPSQTATSEWKDEQSQHLIHELNTQMQTHLATVEQLRAECIELRQSEKHLRSQIESLHYLINTPIRNPELPPLPRPLPTPAKTSDNIEDAEQIQALQTAVVHITLQLQSDAENVSGLTNRIAQILRERDEVN